MRHHIVIRAAKASDVPRIGELLAPAAAAKLILPRSDDELFQHLQEFLLAEYDGNAVGVVAMHIYGTNLGEVRSLVVDPQYRAHGVGRLLVEACERWAKGLGIVRLFALTYVPEFFQALGYVRVSKESLPHKIWTVCVHCAKFAECDEVAVQKQLSDAPVLPMTMPPIIEAIEGD
ncbi:MAG: N-acetyltransferase [Zetaproteobacteria bacterium]|nr:MAG: N-acetyltransferase [Zetaproteobacteria bacterium]